MPVLGLGLGIQKGVILGSAFNCATKVITNSLRAKILAGGGTANNLKCLSTYLDTNFTTSSLAECTVMSLRAKIEAGGGNAGDLTCVENYLSLNFYD